MQLSQQPTSQPSEQHSTQPSDQPSTQPSGQPSVQPSVQPTVEPSVQPSTAQPSIEPTVQPTVQPSEEPSTVQPSVEPTVQPTVMPTFPADPTELVCPGENVFQNFHGGKGDILDTLTIQCSNGYTFGTLGNDGGGGPFSVSVDAGWVSLTVTQVLYSNVLTMETVTVCTKSGRCFSSPPSSGNPAIVNTLTYNCSGTASGIIEKLVPVYFVHNGSTKRMIDVCLLDCC